MQANNQQKLHRSNRRQQKNSRREGKGSSSGRLAREGGSRVHNQQQPSLPLTNCCSYTFFTYLNPFISLSNRINKEGATLEENDLPLLWNALRCNKIMPDFRKAFIKGKVKLWRALVNVMGWRSYLMVILHFIGSILSFSGPFFMRRIIVFFEENEEDIEIGYLYAGLMLICMILMNFCVHHAGKLTIICFIKGVFSGYELVYSKTLKLSEYSAMEIGTGTLMNLITKDTYNLSNFFLIASLSLTLPFTICLALGWLYYEVGWCALIGLLIFGILSLFQKFFLTKLFKYSRQVNNLGDERTKKTQEYLTGIRTLKYLGWEKMCYRNIFSIRIKELFILLKTRYFFAVAGLLAMLAPISFLLVVFWIYTAQGNDLKASTAFTVIAIFGIFSMQLSMIMMFFASLARAKIAYSRLNAFAKADESTANTKYENPKLKEGEVRLKKMSCAHMSIDLREQIEKLKRILDTNTKIVKNREEKMSLRKIPPILKGINIHIRGGELLGIVGAVGSGKTSLIKSLLGEMPIQKGSINYNGRIAYVPQDPWIINASLKDNIIMGMKVDQIRYNQVIHHCQLLDDIQLLPNTDLTEIGEKGINLSGGQKQRVSLARALYSNANIYFFDNCLESLDPHVAHAVFQQVINDDLSECTRILCTHSSQFFPELHRSIEIYMYIITVLFSNNFSFIEKQEFTYILKCGQSDHSWRELFYEEKQLSNSNKRNRSRIIRSLQIVMVLDEGSVVGLGTYEKLTETNELFNKLCQTQRPIIKENDIDSPSSTSKSMESHKFKLPQTQSPKTMGKKYEIEKRGRSRGSEEQINSNNNKCRFNNIYERCNLGLKTQSKNSDSPNKMFSPSRNIRINTHPDSNRSFRSVSSRGDNSTHKMGVKNRERGRSSSCGRRRDNGFFAMEKCTQTSGQATATKRGQLVHKEKKEKGSVKAKLYIQFLNYGGVCLGTSLLLLFALVAVCKVLQNWWVSNWTEDEFEKPNSFYIYGYALFALATGIFLLIQGILFAIAANKIGRSTHEDLLKSILECPLSWFDRTPVGRTINRTSRDQMSIDFELPHTLLATLQAIFLLLGNLILIAFVLYYFLIMVLILVIGFIYYFNIHINGRRDAQRLMNTCISPIFCIFTETLSGLPSIRTYGHSKLLKNKLMRVSDLTGSAFFITEMIGHWLLLRVEIFTSLALGVVCGLCIAMRDSLNPGLVGLSISNALTICLCVAQLVNTMGQTQIAMNSFERITEYIDTNPKEKSFTSPVPPKNWPKRGKVQFNNLKLKYRDDLDCVIKGINLNLKPGEKLGIAGRSGAGKSTITLGILRIIEPFHDKLRRKKERGQIIIDGYDLEEIGLDYIRQRISIIPQDPVLFSGSVRMNIDPFGEYSDREIISMLTRVKLMQVIAGKYEESEEREGAGISSHGKKASTPIRTRSPLSSTSTASLEVNSQLRKKGRGSKESRSPRSGNGGSQGRSPRYSRENRSRELGRNNNGRSWRSSRESSEGEEIDNGSGMISRESGSSGHKSKSPRITKYIAHRDYKLNKIDIQTTLQSLTHPNKAYSRTPSPRLSHPKYSKKELVKSLDYIIREGGSNFSHGEKQLFCTARALIRKPKVLLMDEATASVDEHTDNQIQKIIHQMKDTTIITIAHRVTTIIEYDRIILLDTGHVKQFDTPLNLLENKTGPFHKMVKKGGIHFLNKMISIAHYKERTEVSKILQGMDELDTQEFTSQVLDEF